MQQKQCESVVSVACVRKFMAGQLCYTNNSSALSAIGFVIDFAMFSFANG